MRAPRNASDERPTMTDAQAPTQPSILLVDDDAGITSLLAEVLQEAGCRTVGVHRAEVAMAELKAQRFDLMVTDLVLPDMRGDQLLAHAKKLRPEMPVVLITAFGSMDLAAQALRQGASDFIAKPFTPEQFLLAVQRVLFQAQLELKSAAPDRSPPPDDDAHPRPPASPRMRDLERLAWRAASTDASVLITGESGSGKSRLAAQIHALSPRAAGPFVVVNCGSIPDALVESELFGVVKGAFTDAKRDREGLVQAAHGGTLFLDEIADLPAEAQAKLLRVLERRVVRPVGAVDETPVDLRVLSATHQPLERAIAEGRFRADLYYRLHVIKLSVPPLRERPEDILALAEELLLHHDPQRRIQGFDAEAEAWLLAWSWPGNIRELSNRVQRASALAAGPLVGRADLEADDAAVLEPPTAEAPSAAQATEIAADGLPVNWEPRTLAEVEREHIERTLRFTGGNKAMAAELLGIDRRTLYRRLAEEPN